jgi:hypothetical protein
VTSEIALFLIGGKPQQDVEDLKFRQVLEVASLGKLLSFGMVGFIANSLCGAVLL